MNVYDFDNTIYNGDSTLDFFKYCLCNYKETYITLPGMLFGFCLYKVSIINKIAFKQRFFRFLKLVPDVDAAVVSFWDKNEKKIWSWYLEQKEKTDLIISASPEFLLNHICKKLDIRLIASRVDKITGEFTGENCYGTEKVKRLEAEGLAYEVEAFYSDSLSDKPLADLAIKAYYVRNGNIADWI
jgi:phosphoserine phosphatase